MPWKRKLHRDAKGFAQELTFFLFHLFFFFFFRLTVRKSLEIVLILIIPSIFHFNICQNVICITNSKQMDSESLPLYCIFI